MSEKIMIAVSGGLDSTVLLSEILANGDIPVPVHFQYGSKHNKYEKEAIRKIINHYGLSESLIEIDLSEVFKHFESNLLKSGGEIPEGHYAEESMKQTIVPARNFIFISILTGLANSKNINKIALAVHSGDHFIYPDCRKDFIRNTNQAAQTAIENYNFKIIPYFINYNKADIVKIGIKNNVPFELTRTCYKNQILSCGKCGSCNERLEAFEINRMEDKIKYESSDV